MNFQNIIDFFNEMIPDDEGLKELMENIVFPVL